VIPNFSLAGSILSRNHGLATFVHKRLEWSLVHQSPEQSETEWLCVDVAGYKIVNVYKPPRSRLTPTTIPTSHTPVCMLATSTVLLSPVPRLGKLHRLATREERGTQAWRPRVHQVREQAAVRPMEDSNTQGPQYLRTWAHFSGGHRDGPPPHFQVGRYNMPCPSHFFLFRFCIWTGFKNKMMLVTFSVFLLTVNIIFWLLRL